MLTRHAPAAAWSLTLLMALLTAGMAVSNDAPALVTTSVPWIVMAAVFTITEARSIHLITSRGAHTLNPVEVPLMVALGLLTGPQVILARVVGALVFVGVIRRQQPLKAAFNTAAAGLAAAIASEIGQQAGADIARPATWLWLLIGTIAGGMATSVAVAIVLSLFDPGRTLADVADELRIAAIQVGAGALVGLAVLLPIVVNLWSALVSAVLAIGFHGALLVYGRLRQRHAELDSLYVFSSTLGDAGTVSELAATIAAGVGRSLKVLVVEVTVDELGATSTWTAEGAPLGPSDASATRLAVPLRSGLDTTIGQITVTGRNQDEVALSDADRDLLTALASHAAASLGRALVEHQLRQEIATSEALVKSKDQLIAAVSHELRTPLTGILGFAQVLTEQRNGLDDESKRELASTIADQAQDLSHIVEDLLTAARFGLGQLAMKLEPVAIDTLARSAMESIERHAGRHITLEADHVLVMADPPRARQILRNLVSNAVRYGGPTIEVRSTVTDGHPCIEVRDNGTGVDAVDAVRVFQPYETAHPSTTQPGSVGLGLPISRELARMMGGDVEYRRDNGWTVFILRLQPANAAAVEALPLPEATPCV